METKKNIEQQILLVWRGTRLLKFQTMYCTVQCISRQQLACYGCVALISVFFKCAMEISGAPYCRVGSRGFDYRDRTND